MTDDEQKKIIADNLQNLISQSGKDQKRIAIDLDIQPTTFNSWVKGRALPPVSQLQRISSYFRVGLLSIVNENFEATRKELLLSMYNSLNEDGKKELIKFANLLLKSGEYSYTEWKLVK